MLDGKLAVNILRKIGAVLVQLSGAMFSLMGLGCSSIGTIFPYRIPQSHLYIFFQLVVCVVVVLVGVATMFRFRIAAMAMAGCFLAVCIDEAYGMAHGFFLPQPPHYSGFQIVTQLLVGLIPVVLIAFAWPRLRSIRRTI